MTTIDASLLFSEARIRNTCRGVPIRTYGYTHVLAESPDLLDQVRLQAGNDAPLAKVHPKASVEIRANGLGVNTPRMPRSQANDYLPQECINLIDGDPDTCWSSRTQPQSDLEPVWIRLDLPAEHEVSRIVLHKRAANVPRVTDGSSMVPEPGAVEVGRGMPLHLTIRLGRDGQTWRTVFDGPSGDTPGCNEFVCDFPPCRAKQVWIIGRRLQQVENWFFSFSIARVEALDPAGQDLALATRGTGVTVSSTQHGFGITREEHRWLWPLVADLGVKWVRVGFHDDPVNWHWVERERGRLAVDPEADAAIDYLAERGVNILMVLNFGNRLYNEGDQTRKLPQLWEWYYENPKPPTTPAALEGWARYVRFIARHFRRRVKVFEIWNEWSISLYWGAKRNLEQYLAVVRTAIPILRQECPECKVMLGGYHTFPYGLARWTPEEFARCERENLFLGAVRATAAEVDAIGWHPCYQRDPDVHDLAGYAADIEAIRAWCRSMGFSGRFAATEFGYGTTYPPPASPPSWYGEYRCSELEKAKLVARMHVIHTACDVDSFFCESWTSYYPMDLSLLRRGFTADPVAPMQPQPAYYVMRNLATALEDLRASAHPARIEGGPPNPVLTVMERSGERVVSAWAPGRPGDACPGIPADILVPGRYRKVMGYDPLNGVEQPFRFIAESDRIRVPAVLIKDYPVLIRCCE